MFIIFLYVFVCAATDITMEVRFSFLSLMLLLPFRYYLLSTVINGVVRSIHWHNMSIHFMFRIPAPNGHRSMVSSIQDISSSSSPSSSVDAIRQDMSVTLICSFIIIIIITTIMHGSRFSVEPRVE